MSIRNNRITRTMFLPVLLAAAMIFVSFMDPVWAEEESHVHEDPATFQKNFVLSVDQKQYTITECERVVSEIIKPEMSDLEKYYTLAIWANKRVVYDWELWGGSYNFDYYSHQWDAYGAMKEDEKSVCVGIAIFYSNLCHAADLPCRFVRLNPSWLDHTIDYVPDINGNAYYADITENVFLMSEKSSNSYEPNVDKAFAHITKYCTEPTFDFLDSEGKEYISADIKSLYNTPYADWFDEYALHNNTKKKFGADYVEKGSGVAGTHYASYRDYISNFTDHPDVWFLDDFYEDPATIKSKILNREFDEQLLNVSGVKKNYECNSQAEIEAAVAKDLSIEYFPSSEGDTVVAKPAALVNGTDYKLTCTNYNEATKTVEFTVEGMGAYTGTYQIQVKMNSAVVVEPPVHKKGLEYNGDSQELVEPGVAENGEMYYAFGTETEPTGEFTTAIPAATEAGKYYVWYKAVGDAKHGESQPQRVERGPSIYPASIEAKNGFVTLSKTAFTYNGKVRKPSITEVGDGTLKPGTDYTLKWSDKSSRNVGTYSVTVTGKGNYTGDVTAMYTIDPKGTSLKKLTKAKKAITVKWKKQAMKMSKSRITGYQIRLATDSKFTKNKKTVKVKGYKKVARKIGNLKGGKKYYVKIRTYKTINGETIYSAWSRPKTVTTGK